MWEMVIFPENVWCIKVFKWEEQLFCTHKKIKWWYIIHCKWFGSVTVTFKWLCCWKFKTLECVIINNLICKP